MKRLRLLSCFMVIGILAAMVLVAQENQECDEDADDGQEMPNCEKPEPSKLSSWEELEMKRLFEFVPSNPEASKCDEECYIWTPRETFIVGEGIPLYIEFVAKKRIFAIPNFPPVWAINTGLYTLRIKRDKHIIFPLSLKYPIYEDKAKYIPSLEEIDFKMLHGRLKFPEDRPLCKNYVDCNPGDSYVLKIPDLTAGWRKKTTADGRCLVLFCERSYLSNEIGKDVWLDIRGRYKVQFEHSNIIEFEIR